MNPYYKALILASAGLTLKSIIVKLLNIRARIGTDTFGWPEDKAGLKLLLPLLKLVMLTDIKVLQDKETLDRLVATDANNTNNEPWLIIAATLWGLTTQGNPAAYAINLIYGIVATRSLHNLFFIARSEPLRTLAYLPGYFGTLFITIETLRHALVASK